MFCRTLMPRWSVLLPFGRRAPQGASDRTIVNALISSHSEGNISLQWGQLITEGDVEKAKNEVFEHRYLQQH